MWKFSLICQLFRVFSTTSNLQGRQGWYIRRKKLHLLAWREVWLKYVTSVPLDLWAINTNKYTLSSVAKGFVGVLLLFKLIFIGIRYLVQKTSERNILQSQETGFLRQCTTALSRGRSGLLLHLYHPPDPACRALHLQDHQNCIGCSRFKNKQTKKNLKSKAHTQ